MVETFVFGGANNVPSLVDVDVHWEATEAPMHLGSGTSVPPDDPAAFLGRFARARAVGSFSGSTLGFDFRSRSGASSDQGFAEIGTERNGVFLS